MKRLYAIVVILAASCLMPSERTGTTEQPVTWQGTFDACRGYCLHVYGYHCPATLTWNWYRDCADDCYDLAYEADAAGCDVQATEWMQCEQTEQYQCIAPWSNWPYQTTDYCGAEQDAYEACRSDS